MLRHRIGNEISLYHVADMAFNSLTRNVHKVTITKQLIVLLYAQ